MSPMYRAPSLLAIALLAASACSQAPDTHIEGREPVESYDTIQQGLVAGCGNGVVEPELGEACDDGNHASFDGCDPLCQVEDGYVCVGDRPSICSGPDRSDGPSTYGEARHQRSRPPVSPFSGTEFWTAFPLNREIPDRLTLKIAGDPGTQGVVQSKDGTVLDTFNLPVGGVSTVTVDVDTYEVRTLGAVTAQGIRISADNPIRVIATSEHPYSTDTWAAWSTGKLGMDYRVLDLEGLHYLPAFNGQQRILFVGTAAGTAVTLLSRAGVEEITFTLDAGDTYLYNSETSNSGFRILSSAPIAVITGGFCDRMDGYCDMTAEQLPPVRNWARDYVITPGFPGTTTRSRHAVYAASDETAVAVTKSDGQTFNRILEAGERWIFADAQESRDNGFFVMADKPIAAATLTEDRGKNWDPSLVFWPPVDGYVTEAKMPTSGSLVAYSNFLSVITRTNATSHIRVNGDPISGWKPIASSGYSFTIISVPNGDNEITALSGIKFGAIATGGQSDVSYGYSSPFDISAVGGTTTAYLGDIPPDYEGPLEGSWLADADDLDGIDDEDALTFPSSIRLGDPSPSLVIPCNDNYLGEDAGATVHGWIDFNRDGIFSEEERASAACDDPSLGTTGEASLSWADPSYGMGGITLIRLRICDAASTCDTPHGTASSGEAEDHLVHLGSCGDGFVDTFDACDDGNNVGGDGCSATCTVEPDFVCSGNPSFCLSFNAPTILQPADGSLISQQQADVSGSCEEGAVVRIWDGETEGCSASCVNATFSCTLTGLVDGSHPISADQSYSGLTSIKSAATILHVDRLDPDVPVLGSPVDGDIIGSPRPVFSGSCEPGAEVALGHHGGASVCTSTCSIEGSFSCSPASDLAEGSLSLSLSQIDVGGRSSPSSAPFTITIDTTAPGTPIITVPAEGVVLDSHQVTISGSCESGAEVTIYQGLRPLCTASCEASAFSCDPVALANQDHSISARQRDPAGNTSPFSAIRSFSVLGPPPAPIIVVPTEAAYVRSGLITVSCLPGNTVSVTDGTDELCNGLCPASTFACLAPLPEGVHTIFVSQTDSTPTSSPQSPPRTFTFDTTAPPAPALTHPIEGWETRGPTVGFEGSCDAEAVIVEVVNGPATLCSSACVDERFACTSPALSEAIYQVTVRQHDHAGNVSPDSAKTTFLVDQTPPGSPTLIAPLEGSLTGSTPQIEGSCDAVAVEVLEGATLLCSSACTDASFGCTTTLLSEGTHTIAAVQSDRAGNRSAPSLSVSFTVDTIPPLPAELLSPAPGEVLGEERPTFEGMAEPFAAVSVWSDGVLIGSTAAAADGSWSCISEIALADGRRSIEVRSSDAAGNESPSERLTPILVDTQEPEAPSLLAPAEGQAVSGWTTFIGMAERGTTVLVSVDGVVICSAVADLGSRYACLASARLNDGPHNASAVSVDEAGNESVSSAMRAFSVALEAQPGQPVILVPAEGNASSDDPPSFGGEAEPGSTVKVLVNGVEVCTTAASAAGEFSCSPARSLPDGEQAVKAVAMGSTGQSAASLPTSFLLDRVPPQAPRLDAPTEETAVGSSPTLVGDAEPGSQVRIMVDDVEVCEVVAEPSGYFGCLPEMSFDPGLHSILLEATDAGGNTSAATASSFTVQIGQPPRAILLYPQAGISAAGSTVAFTGRAEPGSTVAVNADGIERCSTVALPSGDWLCTAVLDDGAHSIEVKASNQDGLGEIHQLKVFYVDTIAPETPTVLTPAADESTDSRPSFNGLAEAGSRVHLYVDGQLVCVTQASETGAFSCALLLPLGMGAHSVHAVAIDLAGHVSEPSAVVDFFASPAVLSLDEPSTERPIASSMPTFSGKAEPLEIVSVIVDGEMVCQDVADSNGDWSCTPAQHLADGPRVVNVSSDNGHGTVRTTPDQAYVIDTIAPSAPIIDMPREGDELLGNATTFVGEAEPGALVRVLVDGAEVCTTVADTDGSWRCEAVLRDGSHEVSATATDAAANVSSTSATVSFTTILELSAPSLTSPAQGAYLTSAEVLFAGRAIPRTTVTVYDEDGAPLCSGLVDDSGAFECMGIAQRGTNVIHARSTWLQELESQPSAPITFTVAGAGRFKGGSCASSSGGASTWAFLALGVLFLGRRSVFKRIITQDTRPMLGLEAEQAEGGRSRFVESP